MGDAGTLNQDGAVVRTSSGLASSGVPAPPTPGPQLPLATPSLLLPLVCAPTPGCPTGAYGPLREPYSGYLSSCGGFLSLQQAGSCLRTGVGRVLLQPSAPTPDLAQQRYLHAGQLWGSIMGSLNSGFPVSHSPSDLYAGNFLTSPPGRSQCDLLGPCP